MNVSVIGTGYVGLVVGAGLAETGNTVCCANIDERKIGRLRQKILPIYDQSLLGRLRTSGATVATQAQRLTAANGKESNGRSK